MFNPTFVNNTDIDSLAKHRLALSNKASSSPQVNVSFAGLAEILQLQKTPVAAPAASVNTPQPAANVFCPKMTLKNFCNKYQLSAAIETKLDALGITGPHALRFLSKDDL